MVVVVLLDSRADFIQVQHRSRIDPSNTTVTYKYERRNQIRVYEVPSGSSSLPEPTFSFVIPEEIFSLDDGNEHTLRIAFDSSQSLCIYLATPSQKSSENVDWRLLVCGSVRSLKRVLDDDGNSWVGFTSGSGVASQLIQITSFEYCSILGCGDRANRIY